MNNLYIAWIGFQRRQVSISAHLRMELFFHPIPKRTPKLTKALNYLGAAYATWCRLLVVRPRIVWVQVPQTPALWVAQLYRLLVCRDAKVIADCHNACFRAPWANIPFGMSSVRRADYVLVHNESLRSIALEHGINDEKLVVLEDPPARFKATEKDVFPCNAVKPWGLFPAGFADDEPIQELIEAAAKQPNVTFLVTGNTANLKNRDLLKLAPANLNFLGFLSREDFDLLVLTCDFVLALTKFDGIQLSVCGEAVGAGKPMLVSDTPLLKHLYPAGSEYVQPTAESIAAGVQRIIGRLEEAAAEMAAFRDTTETRWKKERFEPFFRQIDPCLSYTEGSAP